MENRKPLTEEERRERVRRGRMRKEVHQQRMRRKKLIRLSVYVLIVILAVLLILAVFAIVRRVREDRAEQAVEEAIQEEITSSSFYDTAQVLHLSFPVLTLDQAGSGLSVSQFRLILEDLYASGYVLVDPYMLAGRNEKGYTAAQLMVPADKKPMILSQYGVSYTEGDTDHAEALTKDASGRISCLYYDEYGTKSTGAVDVVPLVEEFIESHPDFSYKGARGIVGVTGGSGLLGYQIEPGVTDVTVIPIKRPQADGEEDLYGSESADVLQTADGGEYADAVSEQQDALSGQTDNGSEQPDAGEQQENERIGANRETVKDLVSTLRSGGWYLASNTFDGISYSGSDELVNADAEKWNTVIAPLTGATDLLMLPGGADIGPWSGYTDDNARYIMLRDLGFRYFFINSEETKTWAQVRPAYVRQGVHEITDYASYLALMNENSEQAAQEPASGEEENVEELHTNGTLQLVGGTPQSAGE